MSAFAIYGATGTIGRCIAEKLAAQGHTTLLIGRNAEKLAALAAHLNQPSSLIDLSQSQSFEEAIAQHPQVVEQLDGVINCIGSLLLKPAHLTSDADFRQVLEINLFSAFAVTKACGKLLTKRGGNVVLFASAAAEIGLRNHEAIAAAKAGIIGLARSAAATYAGQNVRFNVVSPGLVRTELTRGLWQSPVAEAASAEMHGLGRIGEPNDIADLACWLVSSENRWMTGQVVGCDGGLAHIVPRRKASPT